MFHKTINHQCSRISVELSTTSSFNNKPGSHSYDQMKESFPQNYQLESTIEENGRTVTGYAFFDSSTVLPVSAIP